MRPKASQPSQRVCVLVLGMHRSGTSAFTRVLSLLGCDLPKTLIGPGDTNRTGHWESDLIRQLNDGILASAGSDWDDWLEINPGWLQSPKAGEYRDEALRVLQEEFGSSRIFVLKDPRICRLLPFWLEVLEEAGAQPGTVFPLRNPLEVAASLQRRNGFAVGLGQLIWLRHVLDAEFASRGMRRFFTSYDRLLNGWARTAEDAQAALDISWPRMSAHVVSEIETFLSENHRHHREEIGSILENPTLSGWLRDAYRVLEGWVSVGEMTQDFAVLDGIRTELNSAAPAFVRLIGAGQKAATKLAKAEKTTAAVQKRAAVLETELKDARRRLIKMEQRICQLETRPHGARSPLEQANSSLAGDRQNAVNHLDRNE